MARTATACPVRPVQKESVPVSEAGPSCRSSSPGWGALRGVPHLCCLHYFWDWEAGLAMPAGSWSQAVVAAEGPEHPRFGNAMPALLPSWVTWAEAGPAPWVSNAMLIKCTYYQMLLFFKTVIVMHIFKHNQREQSSGLHVSVSYLPTTSILSPPYLSFPSLFAYTAALS